MEPHYGYTITMLQPHPKYPSVKEKARFKELIVYSSPQAGEIVEDDVKAKADWAMLFAFYEFVMKTLKECLSEDISAERRRTVMLHDFPDFIADNDSYKRMKG
jgi:hypothetical protein